MKIKKMFFALNLIGLVLFSLLSSSLNSIIRIIIIGVLAIIAFILFFQITLEPPTSKEVGFLLHMPDAFLLERAYSGSLAN